MAGWPGTLEKMRLSFLVGTGRSSLIIIPGQFGRAVEGGATPQVLRQNTWVFGNLRTEEER